MTVEGLLSEKPAKDEKLIVVGGGLVGSECALVLSMEVYYVTLIEMMPEIAKDLQYINRGALLKEFEKYPVEILTNTKCLRIEKDNLICETKEMEEICIPFDRIIAATGTRPESKKADALKSAFDKVHIIGDCIKPGKVGDAVHKAFMVANNI